MAKDHVLHSRAGKLGTPGVSTLADVDRILGAASHESPTSGLVIHFHGGLVNAPAAEDIADRLTPLYEEAGAYPLFFIWESGLIETLRNNLSDIKDDSVFRELVKKAAEWVAKQIGGAVGKGAGAAVDKAKMRKDFDDWFDGSAAEPPIAIDSGAPDGQARAILPDEDDLAANIEAELDNDERFQEVMAGLYVASGRGDQATTRSGQPPAADVEVLVDRRALQELFPGRKAGATKGLFTWAKVAKFVAKIIIAVVGRRVHERDHGIYPTVVEEVLRAAYLDKVGEVVWRSMKKDTLDAFGADPSCVGTAVLARLAALQAEGKTFSKITLVGHSTGAIYINHWIEQAAERLPGVAFDIVLLAPASRFEDFAHVLTDLSPSVRGFRMFAMTDENESKDKLLSIVYPRSLLYFVSGVLEGEPDVPIMGMQRFLKLSATFDPNDFPELAAVRTWLDRDKKRSVWSIDERTNGLGSRSLKHGDFDNDALTLSSVCWIIRNGW